MTLRSAVRDIRSLGAGVPLRALYEGSKRIGTHRVLFGRLAQKARTAAAVPPFPPPGPIPNEARRRAMDAALQVASGKVRVFGRMIDLGRSPDWHHAIERDVRWPLCEWWTIDVRSEGRPADVKWVWEVGRHHHLVLLARGVYLEPNDDSLSAALNEQLDSWIKQNPLERGIHWYSNLEIAIRSICWLQILGLARDAIPEALHRAMGRVLYHSGRHLIADLPYTLSTMRNNHLIGDALGLVALGRAFPGDRSASRWARIGDMLLLRQLRRHFRDDGSTIEDALSYHRFVLDMLAMRSLLVGPPPQVLRCLVAGTQFLARLGALEGPLPQYGDWDEGRVLSVGGDPSDFRGIVRLGLALAGTGAPHGWTEAHDELAWYSRAGEPLAPHAAEANGADAGAGIARAARGSFRVWLKSGCGPSHGHADLLSTPIAFNGQWVVGDPGTGAYNGPIEERNYFRSSVPHSVLRIEGLDQLEPHRAFRWMHTARALAGPPVDLGDKVVMWGVHDAYRRLDPPTRVARVVIVSSDGVTVSDWVERPAGRTYELSMGLHPAATWQEGHVLIDDGTFLLLDLPSTPVAVRGSRKLYDGWWSDTYGSAVPATRLSISAGLRGPVAWSMRVTSDRLHRLEDDWVVADEVRFRIRWILSSHQVELVIKASGAETRRALRWQ